MARPIKPTPVLKGKDAIRFENEVQANVNKKLSTIEIQKIESSYQRISKLSQVGCDFR